MGKVFAPFFDSHARREGLTTEGGHPFSSYHNFF